MSKRSYRRLAAVTGAALAIGAMAPALAAQVGASVSADPSPQVTDVTGLLPSTSGLLPPTGLVSTAQSTVAAALWVARIES